MTDETTVIDRETGEVLETPQSKEVVISDQVGQRFVVDGLPFEIVKLVNVLTLKHDSGKTVYVRMDGKIQTSPNKNSDNNADISVVRVTELISGQPFDYVCNAMTVDNLKHVYPEDSYVGKCFAISKSGVVAGKRYKETHVVEIQPAS